MIRALVLSLSSILLTTPGVAIASPTTGDACLPSGGPSPDAAGRDVAAVYGQPATLWITNSTIGISTSDGYGQAVIRSASPLPRSALLVDAQQDGTHQIIVDTGREALLYSVTGCSITPVVDEHGDAFQFDLGHRRGLGDGVGCSDLGDGRRLVQLLQLPGRPPWEVRRTAVDLIGPTATLGRSDTVTATSEHDPAWTTASEISCGDLTIARDGVATR